MKQAFHVMYNEEDDTLNIYQYRLLGHYRRVCGKGGECFESTRTTSERIGISASTIVRVRRQLADMGKITLSAIGQRVHVKLVEPAKLFLQDNGTVSVETQTVTPQKQSVSTVARTVIPQKQTVTPQKQLSEGSSLYVRAGEEPIKKNHQEEPIKKQLLQETVVVEVVDEKRPNVFSAYEQNIGALTGIIGDELKSLVAEYSEAWVIDAIREAVLHEKRTLAYAKGCLKTWKREGRGIKPQVPPAASPPVVAKNATTPAKVSTPTPTTIPETQTEKFQREQANALKLALERQAREDKAREQAKSGKVAS